MPIRYQYQRHKGRTLVCPVIFCDTCGKQIKRSSDGLVDYMMKGESNRSISGEPYFSHRDGCAPKRRIGSCMDTVDHFLDCLVNNAEHEYGSSKSFTY